MPTYVYRNLTTQETFEVKQSMKDAALTQHPQTGEPVKRLVSAPAIAFKGSGFYANDSRATSKAASPASTAESGNIGSTQAESSASADSASTATPAATPAPKVDAAKTAEKSSPAKSTPPSGGTGQ